MARPRFHSQTESLTRSSGQNNSGLALQNFNLLPVKDTNGRNGGSGNNKTAIEEDDIIPVKEAPLSVSSTVVATSSSSSLPPSSKIVLPAEKDILIVDKDFDEKIKSNFSFLFFSLFDFFFLENIEENQNRKIRKTSITVARRAECCWK